MGMFPSKTNIMGTRIRNSSRELISWDKRLLKTNICLGIYTLVTRLGLPTMELRDDVVPLAKKRHAIMPTSKLMAKFSSWAKTFLNTKNRTMASRNGLRTDQRNPSEVF